MWWWTYGFRNTWRNSGITTGISVSSWGLSCIELFNTERCWNNTDRRNPKYNEDKLVQSPPPPPPKKQKIFFPVFPPFFPATNTQQIKKKKKTGFNPPPPPHHKSQIFWPGFEPVCPLQETYQITRNYKTMNYPLKAFCLWPGVYCNCCINLTSFSLWLHLTCRYFTWNEEQYNIVSVFYSRSV